MATGKEESGPSALEREIEETRERLAGTIDQLMHRSSPKTIVSREVAGLKAYFVDPATGQPRTENILKVVGGVVGTVVVFAADPEGHPVTDKPPIRMLHDRILVELDQEAGERRSSGGIVIPATAAMGARRLAWSRVVAIGPHARSVEIGDRVLFDPDDKSEVEVQGDIYVLMRERDVHAVAADRLDDGQSTGLYL